VESDADVEGFFPAVLARCQLSVATKSRSARSEIPKVPSAANELASQNSFAPIFIDSSVCRLRSHIFAVFLSVKALTKRMLIRTDFHALPGGRQNSARSALKMRKKGFATSAPRKVGKTLSLIRPAHCRSSNKDQERNEPTLRRQRAQFRLLNLTLSGREASR
jgi:hypothetical protein